MELIIEKLSKESNFTEKEIKNMMNDITISLIKEGCPKNDPKFIQYLIRRIRKRLKIEESITYKSFKNFFQK